MNDLIEGCCITGQVLLDGEDIYKGHGCEFAAAQSRHGVPEAEPVSIYLIILPMAPERMGIRSKESVDEIVEKALR